MGIMYSFLWPEWSAMCCFPLYLVFGGKSDYPKIESFPFFARCFDPMVIPPVSSSILFRTLLDANTGPITQMIKFITGKSVMILDQADTALIAVIVHNFGGRSFAMLFLAIGLTMISKDVYEAAIIDGASKIKQFFTLRCLW